MTLFGWMPGSKKPRLRLAQSLGAFTRPEQGDISPLYVFFEVENADRETIEVSRVHVTPKDGDPVQVELLEGDRDLPHILEPGDTARYWTQTRPLARILADAGYGGRPRLRLVVEDGLGNTHEKRFAFRVDEYLRLRDE